MKKNISFMRSIYTQEELAYITNFLAPLFENNNVLFKKMIVNGQAYIQEKRFTYILHPEMNKKYRIMGNCIGPIIYVRDVMDINDTDDMYLDANDSN